MLHGTPRYIFSSVRLSDGSLQPGGFTLHFQRGMREFLEPASWHHSAKRFSK
jgi:hypothetical protein